MRNKATVKKPELQNAKFGNQHSIGYVLAQNRHIQFFHVDHLSL